MWTIPIPWRDNRKTSIYGRLNDFRYLGEIEQCWLDLRRSYSLIRMEDFLTSSEHNGCFYLYPLYRYVLLNLILTKIVYISALGSCCLVGPPSMLFNLLSLVVVLGW